MKRSLVLLLVLSGGILSPTVSMAASRPTAAALIQHFKMTRIPQEGPWFTLTYTSEDILPRAALPERYDGPRAAGSAIIGLLTRAADTLAPAFAYSDFAMGYRDELQQAYPRFAALIAQLTRKEFLTRPVR